MEGWSFGVSTRKGIRVPCVSLNSFLAQVMYISEENEKRTAEVDSLVSA